MSGAGEQSVSETDILGRGIGRLSDITVIEQTPLADRHLPPSTYAFLRQGLTKVGDGPSLSLLFDTSQIEHLSTLSGRALLERITQCANAFRHMGVGRNDVVAIILPNLPETHFAIWGGEAAGIAFPLNPALGAEHLGKLFNAANAKLVIALGPTPGVDLWEMTLKAASGAPCVQAVIAVSVSRYLSGPAQAFVHEQHQLALQSGGHPFRLLDFDTLLDSAPGDALRFDEPRGDDIASYFCTGGTTGAPKIARRTHSSEVFNAWVMTLVNGSLLSPGRVVFAALPLFHVNAQLVSGLASFTAGSHVLLGTPQGFRGEGVIAKLWDIVAAHKVSTFSCVPTVISALLQQPIGERDISSLDMVVCGAAPMPKDLFRTFEKTTGRKIIEGYGLTEGACASSVNPRAGERKIGSVGLRIPYQDMRVMILDEDGAWVRDAETNETGVLAIRGPNVFAGYLDPSHDRGIWIERQGETWLNTGDLASEDADGYFWLTGRKKELIIRGGHNIDPKIIEEALAEHPAVAMAAAVGRPDPHSGEIPVAYVQLRAGVEVDESELVEFAAGRLMERAARPKSVHVTPALPTTQVGKVFKPALVLAETEAVIREECAAIGVVPEKIVCAMTASGRPRADIWLQTGAERLSERLGNYSFLWEIQSAGGGR